MRARHKRLVRGGILLVAVIAALSVYLKVSPLSIAAIRITTTNPLIAITNLDSQITSAEGLVKEKPDYFEFRRTLFNLLAIRAQYLGSYSDFMRLDQLSSHPLDSLAECFLRAKYLSTIHDFDSAEKVLAIAEKLGATSAEIEHMRIPIHLARRENLPALRIQQLEELKKKRTYGNLALMAGIESDLGKFESADAYLQEAISSYADSSPFPIAYLYFQRGLLWAEKAGEPSRGKRYYQEAVHYLPQYVVAQVHLAEIEDAEGQADDAIARLRQVSTSGDPEPRGVLAEFLIATKANSEAAELIASAKKDYEKLLESYPFAFSDHGAEFFMGVGAQPERAKILALLNLKNRPSERAYITAIEATKKAQDLEKLCSLQGEATRISPVFPTLKELIRENAAACAH